MALSARKVETAPPGKYVDGRGLMLVVKESGARSWVLRYQTDHRRRDLGLGPYPEVTLPEARDKALEARRRIRRGEDPIAERRKSRALTFRDAADAPVESKRSGWRNRKHAAQWTSTLRSYAFPKLGSVDVRLIDTSEVLDTLRPIWNDKPETASRVRQRIEAVIDYATALGARSGATPARWRGHLDHLLAKPSKVRAVRHHAALGWREVPEFMNELGRREGVSSRALAFAILTAARSGEVRGMRWEEVDTETGVWTVSAGRMKAGKEHRVPLTESALALMGERAEPEALVFGIEAKAGSSLSDMSLGAVLRRMNLQVTVHGFRSTFRDWAGETTAFPREVSAARKSGCWNGILLANGHVEESSSIDAGLTWWDTLQIVA